MKTIFFSANYLKLKGKSYGGGAFFVQNLCDDLKNKGYNITFELKGKIDLIFIIDPRTGLHKHYSMQDIVNYKRKNPNVKIIHRVNECDIKRFEGGNLEQLLLKTMFIADHVIFISKWLQDYFIKKYNLKNKINYSFILNGCAQNIFYPKQKRNNNDVIKIVTHHWSSNYYKGFEIYNKLDKIMEKRKNIHVTFIGNYIKNYNPKNIKLIPPCTGEKLANLIRQNDIYLTASINEPCGMHNLEGISCGLPILYDKKGGGIIEGSENYGIGYSNINDLMEKIIIIHNNYDNYTYKDYSYIGSERCCLDYYNKIKSII